MHGSLWRRTVDDPDASPPEVGELALQPASYTLSAGLRRPGMGAIQGRKGNVTATAATIAGQVRGAAVWRRCVRGGAVPEGVEHLGLQD